MPSTAEPEEGTVHSFERTFTHEDVEQFGEVSGDRQAIHTEPDEEGRVAVSSPCTTSLPSKIGGDLGVLARTMEFEFLTPVYTGESITCEVTTEEVREREDRYDIASSVVCRREGDTTTGSRATREDDTAARGETDREDEVVMRARFEGLIWKDES